MIIVQKNIFQCQDRVPMYLIIFIEVNYSENWSEFSNKQLH